MPEKDAGWWLKGGQLAGSPLQPSPETGAEAAQGCILKVLASAGMLTR